MESKLLQRVFHLPVTVLALAIAVPVSAGDAGFTIAVIPDTQNYVDYSHQRTAGFPFDANAMFMQQMRYIAANVESAGGDIAFVTAVGDVWQHQSLQIDPGHAARGFARVPHPTIDKYFAPAEKAVAVELPAARAGYGLLAGKVPFAVVPGNHDYDAMWPNRSTTAADATSSAASLNLHVGGLGNFNSVFGAHTAFFRDQPWYVASHDGGADSAQIFSAGGYRFLHIGLQFDPPDATLEWARSVIRDHPGLPTLVTTHDYLNKDGERRPQQAIDAHAVDPQDNNPEMVWEKLVRPNEQIFMVLCGHHPGQAVRIDDNAAGRKVYQILADYQDRAQTARDAGLTPDRLLGIGDGWMRLLIFDMKGAVPRVHVRTYSTHYQSFSRDTLRYAAWYKAEEEPDLSDEAFHAEDDFALDLIDFRSRFDRHAGAEAAADAAVQE